MTAGARSLLGRLAEASARNRWPVLVATALVVGILALGLPGLRFEDDPVDAMPTGDPNTLATLNVTKAFPGAAFASPVFVSVAPEKWDAANARLPNRQLLGPQAGGPLANNATATLNDLLASLAKQSPRAQAGPAPALPAPLPGPLNITDEVYMRGQHELLGYLQARVPDLKWAITLESQVRLVNYTNTGIPGPGLGPTAAPVRAPDASAFSMPGTDLEGERQYAADWTGYFVASPASVRSIVSPDWTTTRLAYLFEPGDKPLAEVGAELQDAVQAYRAEVAACDAGAPCSLAWNVFDHDSILVDPRAPTAAAAHLSATTQEDVLLLAPIAAAFVGVCLLVQFRRPGTVAAMVLPLGFSGLGVLGAFGLLGLRIQSASLLVFPVLIGTGIDFGIHMAHAFHAARRAGHDVLAASREAGHHAGRPLMVATVTTLVDMLFLAFAPNDLLRELGIAILLGLTLLMLVSLTALPAALSFCRTPRQGRATLDRALAANARFWRRNRALGWGVVGLTAAAGLVAAPLVETLVIGTPAAFFPPGDPQRQDYEATNARYYSAQRDLVSNILVFEGDLTTPAAMAELADMEAEMKDLDFVRDDSAVSIHFAMQAWIQVRQGTAGVGSVLAREAAQPGSTFPQTQAEVRSVLDEMFQTPLANYISFFIDRDGYDIGVMLVEVDQPSDFAALEPQWQALQRKVELVQSRHEDAHLQVHVSGATAVAYLFTAKELPYLQVAGYLGLVVTALQVWLFRRSLRDAAIVTVCVLVAGAWWTGLLALSAIPLSIALVVPIVILGAIGADYPMHLRFGIAEEGPAAWSGVGRAVVYAAITDLGAFLVFGFMRYGLLRDAAIATVFVLAAALVATLLVVPLLARANEVPTGAPSKATTSAPTPAPTPRPRSPPRTRP